MNDHGPPPEPGHPLPATSLPATKSLADIVAPFGRIPAAGVAFIAGSLFESAANLHAQGVIGFNLDPAHIQIGAGGTLDVAEGVAPYWMLPPERARGQPQTASGDLYGIGALLLELLTGARHLDAGSPGATASLLLARTGPPPIFGWCPTVPGFLEKLLASLLHPDPFARPSDAQAARGLIDEALNKLAVKFPGALPKLLTNPQTVFGHLNLHQAKGEGERGAKLVVEPQGRLAALVSLLRSNLLLPAQPQITTLLAQAADAGFLRKDQPRSGELSSVLAEIETAEPNPTPETLLRAAGLLKVEGYLLEMVAMLKRTAALGRGPAHTKLEALLGATNPDALWSVGSTSSLAAPPMAEALDPGDSGDLLELDHHPKPIAQPLTQDPSVSPEAASSAPSSASVSDPATPQESLYGGSTTDDPDAGSLQPNEFAAWRSKSDAPPSTGVGALVHALSQAYGNTEPRARLFLLAMTFSAISAVFLVVFTSWGLSSTDTYKNNIEHLVTQAADCQPGGVVPLIKIYQAVKLGEGELAEKILYENDSGIAMGTRCHQYAMMRVANSSDGRVAR